MQLAGLRVSSSCGTLQCGQQQQQHQRPRLMTRCAEQQNLVLLVFVHRPSNERMWYWDCFRHTFCCFVSSGAAVGASWFSQALLNIGSMCTSRCMSHYTSTSAVITSRCITVVFSGIRRFYSSNLPLPNFTKIINVKFTLKFSLCIFTVNSHLSIFHLAPLP
jgi:hypothetical protein